MPSTSDPHGTLYRTAQRVLPGGISSSIRLNRVLGRPFYIARGDGAHLFALADRLYPGMNAIFQRYGFRALCQGLGARFGLYFGFTEAVRDYRDTARQDTELALRFFAGMAERGVYFCDNGRRPSHHGFSAAHTAGDIDRVLQATEDTGKAMQK